MFNHHSSQRESLFRIKDRTLIRSKVNLKVDNIIVVSYDTNLVRTANWSTSINPAWKNALLVCTHKCRSKMLKSDFYKFRKNDCSCTGRMDGGIGLGEGGGGGGEREREIDLDDACFNERIWPDKLHEKNIRILKGYGCVYACVCGRKQVYWGMHSNVEMAGGQKHNGNSLTINISDEIKLFVLLISMSLFLQFTDVF